MIVYRVIDDVVTNKKYNNEVINIYIENQIIISGNDKILKVVDGPKNYVNFIDGYTFDDIKKLLKVSFNEVKELLIYINVKVLIIGHNLIIDKNDFDKKINIYNHNYNSNS